MNNVFISYRREDSEGFARGLFQSLVAALGADHVFMDVEGIGLGTDFVEAIDKSLASCGALLVLIGKDWMSCTDASGSRRLDDPQDFVRMEVAKALEQQVRVIPVLIKGAKMPAPEDLPESLRPVTRRQALELRHERWNQDVEQLTSALAELLGLQRMDRQTAAPTPPPLKPAKQSSNRLAIGLAAVVVVAILAVGGFSLLYEKQVPIDVVQPGLKDQPASDPNAAPAPESSSPPKEDATVVQPKAAVQPKANVQPKTQPKPQQIINLTGLWVDNEGVNVQISHQGGEVVSQAYNPLTGLSINAVWRVSGRQIAFNWMSNAGNQGVGDGTIAADGATVDYRFVDNVTGEQGYGRLYRVTQ